MNNVKDTWVEASFDWQNASFPETEPPVTIYWRIWFNDTVDNRTNTSIMSFTLGVPPSYRNVGTNDSDGLIRRGDAIELRAEGYDDGGLSNASLMIKVNNQPWEEYERIELEGVARTWVWTNFTWQNSSVEEWSTVYWHIIYRDLVGKESTTPTKSFKITPTLWSRVFGSGEYLKATPALGDLNNDHILEIVLPWEGKVYVLSGVDGSTIWESFAFGTPTSYSYSSPVIVDLDNDGQLDFVVAAMGDGGKEIQAFNLNTPFPLWSIPIDDFATSYWHNYHSSPAIAYLNNDLIPEVVIGTRTVGGIVYALHGNNGSIYWACETGGGSIYSTPAVGDISGDNISDVLTTDGDDNLTAIYGNNGTIMWQYKIGHTYSSPALGDLNQDNILEIVVTSEEGCFAFHGNNGTPYWSNNLASTYSSLVIVDLNKDGVPEVVTISGKVLYALHGNNGSVLWSRTIEWTLSSPAIGDINADGWLDIVVGTNGYLYVVNSSDGTSHWKYKTQSDVHSSPIIVDVNGNGFVDVIFVEEGKRGDYPVRVIVFEFQSTSNKWPSFRGSTSRTACLKYRKLTLQEGWNAIPVRYQTFGKASQVLEAISNSTMVARLNHQKDKFDVYHEGTSDFKLISDACFIYVEGESLYEIMYLDEIPSNNFERDHWSLIVYPYEYNMSVREFMELNPECKAFAYWDHSMGQFVAYYRFYTSDGLMLEQGMCYLVWMTG
jgi:outer membrane protein assembly factor BamB